MKKNKESIYTPHKVYRVFQSFISTEAHFSFKKNYC
jgi:hypothetical protein